jgi:formylglycine-generating enzyme required for sulfatase activity
VGLLLVAACDDEHGVPVGSHADVGVGGSAGGAGGEAGAVAAGGSPAQGGAGGALLPPPACPDDMVLAGSSCIDRYEAPNTPGAEPLAMQTAYDGERWCAGHGKRLCTDVEWVRACEGTAQHPYPYGDAWVEHRCNDDKTWLSPDWSALATWPDAAALDEADRLYQADPSGSRAECVSEEGVLDLTGNVAEWVTRTIPNSTNYDHVMKGCYWAGCYGGSHPSCDFVNPAHPGGFRSYEAGFRCCRDAGR